MTIRIDGWAKVAKLSTLEKKELTLQCLKRDGDTFDVPMYRKHATGFLVPRWLINDMRFDATAIVKPSLGATFPSAVPAVTLREAQREPVKRIVQKLGDSGGAVLEAPCGTGKTVMGNEIIRRIGRRALVLVHKTFLMDQWAERIAQFLPGAKVGIWRGNKCELGCDITIGMIQSISKGGYTKDGVFHPYPDEAYSQIGMVVTDECHLAAAPTWIAAITQFSAAFRLGLSATPDRRDQLEGVFFSHIGPIGHTIEGSGVVPRVARIQLDTFIPKKDYVQWGGEVSTAKLVTMLADSEPRTERIIREVVRAVKADRRPLVLTERRNHVIAIIDGLRFHLGDEVSVQAFVGGMGKKKEKLALLADVVVGTYSMADTGLDIPGLDTLFLATPKTGIRQPVGRISGERATGKPPLVVDFVDRKIPILIGYARKRVKLYERLGCKLSNK